MKLNKTGVCALLLVVFSQPASSVPFSLEARSLGMGNVGVATADMASAAFVNPAMLAYQRENNAFSLLAGLGGFLNDNEGLINDIDAFQSALNSNPAEAANILAEIDGKFIAPELSAAVSVGFASDTYAMAISARRDALAVGTLTEFDLNLADPTKNIVEIRGVQTTEVSASIARNFNMGGHKLSVGITPRIVSVETISLSESVTTIGTNLKDLLNEDQVQNLGEYSTFDLGIVYGLSDNIQLGLVGKNIITEEVNIISQLGGVPVTLRFDSSWRAGVAYRNRFLTIGVDLDIVENDPIVKGAAFSGLKTQMASFGAEFNTFDFAQLRIGVMKNIASGISDGLGNPFYTIGVGFWLGFVLDVAVVSGEGESLGAFVQTGFRF